MTKQRETPEQLARKHWGYLETILFTQMKLTMTMYLDGFTHGYEHGRRNSGKRIRTVTPKK